MLPQNKPDRIRILFDDHRLVANAGLLLPATLARHLGLRELVDHHLDLGGAPGRANTGDKAHTWSGLSGLSLMHDPSFSHNRPFLGCLLGTFSPSRRQILSTLLWFTLHPRCWSRAVILRYPYLPNSLASSTISSVSNRSWSEETGSYRWVDRG